MEMPILYYWAPCTTCCQVTSHAEQLGIELDRRDVAEEVPYRELLGLGGDANLIPYLYLYSKQELIQGVEACNKVLDDMAASK